MAKSHSSGNLLFIIFWWFVQHVNVRWAHKLLYMGLRDGSFPSGRCTDPTLGIDIFGQHFLSPVGLADGIDKRGNTLDMLLQMGYSFGSFGPYTLEKEMPPQEKYFFKSNRATIAQCNGYRNPGVLKMLPWFMKRRYLPYFIGIDLAIPAESEESNIKMGRHFTYVEEFTLMAQKTAPYCDYITLDFSHPNAEPSVLIVDSSTVVPIIRSAKQAVQQAAPIKPPLVFVKIPLDLTPIEVPLVAQSLIDGGADAVVVAGPLSLAKNTRIRLKGAKEHQLAGMLYGEPTHQYVNELIRKLYTILKGKVPIIATGGVFDGKTAFAHITAGASLVTVDETSLIYAGPSVIYDIFQGLGKLLKENRFASIAEAIGTDSESDDDEPVDNMAIALPQSTQAQAMAPAAPAAPTAPQAQDLEQTVDHKEPEQPASTHENSSQVPPPPNQ